MVSRSALELEEKGLIEVEEENELEQTLSETGKKVLETGSPEFQLIERVRKESKPFSELQDLDLDVALGKARQKGWIEIEDGKITISDKGKEVENDELQKRLESGDFSDEDEDRGLIETNTLTNRSLVLTDKGKELDLDKVGEDFNITAARTKTPRTGKRHFYKNIIDHARSKWVEMGFEEMSGDFVVPSLLNFDALYTPQDHPARELHDTFFLQNRQQPIYQNTVIWLKISKTLTKMAGQQVVRVGTMIGRRKKLQKRT